MAARSATLDGVMMKASLNAQLSIDLDEAAVISLSDRDDLIDLRALHQPELQRKAEIRALGDAIFLCGAVRIRLLDRLREERCDFRPRIAVRRPVARHSALI